MRLLSGLSILAGLIGIGVAAPWYIGAALVAVGAWVWTRS